VDRATEATYEIGSKRLVRTADLANTDKKTTPQADAIEYPVSCSFEMAQKDIPKTLAVAIRAGKGKPIGSKAPAERPRQGSTNINLWTRKQLNDPNSA
jgi:hypothetical protein